MLADIPQGGVRYAWQSAGPTPSPRKREKGEGGTVSFISKPWRTHPHVPQPLIFPSRGPVYEQIVKKFPAKLTPCLPRFMNCGA